MPTTKEPKTVAISPVDLPAIPEAINHTGANDALLKNENSHEPSDSLFPNKNSRYSAINSAEPTTPTSVLFCILETINETSVPIPSPTAIGTSGIKKQYSTEHSE